jgi:hypothetical protein
MNNLEDIQAKKQALRIKLEHMLSREGKVSSKRFKKILRVVKKYQHVKYWLSELQDVVDVPEDCRGK